MDPVQLIRHDHQNLERLFKRMEQVLPHDDPRAATAVLRDLTRELSVHAAIEEQFLYPALRRELQDGDVLYAIEEHHAVKVTLSELQATSPSDSRFATKVRLLIRNVREHVDEEERELLPALEKNLDAEELRDLGRALSNAKLLSPTRPHPTAPEMPPGNLIAGPVVGVFDRIRDVVRDGLLSIRAASRSALETGMILIRGLSTQAERRGRAAVEDLATRTRVATSEVRDAGKRTFDDAAGRSAEAARQLRAPVRRAARRTRRAARRAASAK